MSEYVIKNCPACRIAPSCCTEWNLLHGEWKDCKDINDCVIKRIVEKCSKKFYDNDFDKGKLFMANEILLMLGIEECE